MKLSKQTLKKQIAVANHERPADLVIKNGQLVDVFNLEITEGDIAISDGMIVGIGPFEGKQVIDADNRYICPSFIDGHVHIESSMVTPAEFSKVVIPHGVTTVITDPHEIGNVAGTEGIQFMLDNSENIPLDVFCMLPSSVPATPFENSGAELLAPDLKPFYSHDRVLGLAEVMDYPSLQRTQNSIIDKIIDVSMEEGKIDGHLAGLNSDAINIYRSAGITTDHECHTASEAKERLKRGMYLLIREGSVAKDLSSLIGVVTEKNARRCLFCTDDKHIDDLIKDGSIDHNVRLAIKEGVDPLLAISMATINAAECYGLSTKGAIAPGYEADFLLLDDLDSIKIAEVYKKGQLVAKSGKVIGDGIPESAPSESLTNTVKIQPLSEKDLRIPLHESNKANIIEIIPNSLRTSKVTETVTVEDGSFTPSITMDQLKICVIERHHHTGNIGRGILKGLGIKQGAIATTVAHDSHNIVAAGTNDSDLLSAVHALEELNGGLVVVKEGNVIASLALPIAGLLSDGDSDTVYNGLHMIKSALTEVGFEGNFNPFLTLSFLTLPVIPSIKITDLGLFDVESFQHISVEAE
ncbi:adenine deaminase [Rossellomorea aquimaris]|uniref:adenine deaminase n=1 Tax=Rossellomorea aquimaris TaxID=189382 RepID=UPI001CD46748|nr:adenine deaminase [Rossellomorea aquimaris]MCA1055645.1 adenine deaminase [Rossellomorea aquimaris]